jgi:hypothetical protein
VIGAKEEQIGIIRMVHEGTDQSVQSAAMSAHIGINTTVDHIRRRFFWHGMTEDVQRYISQCDLCQKSQNRKLSNAPPLQTITIPNKVMYQVGVDITQLPEVHGFKYLIVLVDYFTKWIEGKAVVDKSAATVAAFLYEVICRHGCFKIQINDQGREFVNSLSTSLHELTGVEQRITSAYHPQSNGLVERSNQTQHCKNVRGQL